MTEFKDLKLSGRSYVAVLKRQRERIANWLDFSADDCKDWGNKSTSANWGLCSDQKEAWPHAEDHLWPEQFTNHGRVAPKYRRELQTCPMQTKGSSTGCFYNCMIFKGAIKESDRQKAVELYDAHIEKMDY